MSNFNAFFRIEEKRKCILEGVSFPIPRCSCISNFNSFLLGICYCLSAKLILEGTDGYAASGVYADTGGIGGSGSYGGMDCIENFRISICPLS